MAETSFFMKYGNNSLNLSPLLVSPLSWPGHRSWPGETTAHEGEKWTFLERSRKPSTHRGR